MGVGEATTYPAAGRVIHEWIPVRERALFTTIFNSGAYFGPANRQPGAGLAGGRGRVALRRSSPVAPSGFCWMAAWLIWFRQPERAGWLGAEERTLILRERGDLATAEAKTTTGSMGMAKLLLSRSMIGMMLTQGCAVYTQYLFLTWLPNYLQVSRGISMLKSGPLTAAPYLGAVVLTVLLGKC